MRTKTTPIADRLDPYGRPDCLICGQPKEMSYRDDVSSESVFAGERFQLTCRNHPGHPLHGVKPSGRHESQRDLVSV